MFVKRERIQFSQYSHRNKNKNIRRWVDGCRCVYYVMYFLAPLFIRTENRQKSEKKQSWHVEHEKIILHFACRYLRDNFCYFRTKKSVG